MNITQIGNIITSIKNANSKKERIAILKKCDSRPLQSLFYMNFTTARFDVPEDIVQPKNNNKPLLGMITLFASVKQWYIFSKKSCPSINDSKRTQKFLSLLHALDPIEAEILLHVHKKTLGKFCGVTRLMIEEVYPNLLSSNKEIVGEERVEDN